MTTLRLPLPMAPADPGTAPAVAVASAANPLLDWLKLTDSDGGFIVRYRMMLEPSSYNVLHNTVYSGIVEGCYDVFLILAAYGAAGMELLLTPDRWLGPVSDFYSSVTAAVSQKVPPLAILAVTMGCLILSVFMRREKAAANGPGRGPNSPPPGLLEQWMPSNAQISKAQWNRLGSGLVLMFVVIVLSYNPIKMVQTVVNYVVAIASELTFTGNQGGAATYASSGIANIVRDVSFLINYRSLLAPDCAKQWSLQSINLGSGNPKCLTPAQYAATDPDFWTVLYALAALPIAWGIGKFLYVAAKYLLNHLSLTVVYLVAAIWVAAGTLARRRPYDPIINLVARFATNAVLTIAVLFVTAALPALFVKLFLDLFSFLPVVLQIPLVSLAFYVSARVLTALLKNKESIVGLFRDRVKKSQTYTNLFNLKADQKTLTSQMLNPVGAQLAAPLGWATDRYAHARDWTQQRWTQLRDGTGAPTQEGGAMNVSILPDTPESVGAQRRITLNPEPATAVADRPVIDPAATISPDRPAGPASGGPTADRSAAAPLALVGPGGVTVAALPAGPTTPPGTPGYAWLRGGIPQPMPTTLAQAVPQLPAEPAPPDPAPRAARVPSAPPAQGDDLVDRAGFFQRRAVALRDEAAAMRPSTPAESDLLAAASRTYRALAIPGQINTSVPGQPPSSAPSGAALRRPDFKALLSSAQWTHGLHRAKNLMAARGITTAPVLADAAVTTERIVMATDSQGRAVVRRKNDRGFGDSI